MKIVLLIIDGLGDRSIPELHNKTPLEAAKTPNLDFLAKNGMCGLVNPFYFPWQKYPRSDTAHLALFGYNPKTYYLGRGPYEAAGISFDLKKGDVTLRANFATVDRKLKVIDRRAGRITETESLIKTLNGITIGGIKFLVKKSFGHRAVVILRGKNLSDKISDSDPHKIGVQIKKIIPRNKSNGARFTAKVLNEFLSKAHQTLKNHTLNKKRIKENKLPANYLLLRGAGKFRRTISFYQKYKLKACCVAGGTLYKGIGRILGMTLINVKGATGFANTDLKRKFLAVKKSLGKYDFIFCHIKAVDSFGEDGNFLGKKKFIEKIDRNLNILKNLKNTLIIITGDHATCSLIKGHCLEPVPILVYGKEKDKVREFGERACKKGGFGKMKGLNVMPKILTLAK
ncbi:2,3-bisphosphoglycerate-independent phosphoglycerate mutase [Patescibacteria group bacterium]|nr:2,3-bisphosphoglycerate-independent phosphoglycerate mutase [Patescibacteria group bacterium]